MSIKFETLVGETITDVAVSQDKGTVKFECASGRTFMLTHFQDCCEHVYLEDIVGDLEDLEDATVKRATVDSGGYEKAYGHVTWTFYTIRSDWRCVTFRFYGESNGYYSEAVSFVEVSTDQPENWWHKVDFDGTIFWEKD